MSKRPLVEFRTPTYRRPQDLRRCLEAMRAQTWENWICEVYDDDPDASGRAVVEAIGDPRIVWHHNIPQRFASGNIDACFTRANPRDADWFCVVEDDNLIFPTFAAENIALAQEHDVTIIFRNQLIEHDSGTPEARFSTAGILDDKFREGRYDADFFRLSLIADIGVSNGGLFWSRHAVTDLEIGFECNATLQEYLRTYKIAEPVFVALKPLAVWAENGAGTTRNNGDRAKYLRRELNLKRSVQMLRRSAWARAGAANRAQFLATDAFGYDPKMRASGLVKALIPARTGKFLQPREHVNLWLRGLLINTVGRATKGMDALMSGGR